MPRNLEIKARVSDLSVVRAAAAALGAVPHTVEEQTDRYYTLDGGRRVKLRTTNGRAEMIHYDRPESGGVRASDYTVTPVRDDAGQACLVPKGKPLVTVRKRREILLIDNVRVHLDVVDGLGAFIELEAVIDATHDEAACREQIAAITAALGIAPHDLLAVSYSDLVRGEHRA